MNVLYNRCPHRGAQICSARKGNTGKHFYCSYHAWTFHLDGKLEGMPAKREYEGTNLDFDDPEFHMARPAQVDNYRGFWFVNLSKGGHDLKTHLGEAAAAFDQLIDRAPGKETEIVGDCFRIVQQSNWKIFLENQLDASHPGVTHESTGKAAQKLEAKIRQEGEEPPMELSFLSDFARLGHDGWTKIWHRRIPKRAQQSRKAIWACDRMTPIPTNTSVECMKRTVRKRRKKYLVLTFTICWFTRATPFNHRSSNCGPYGPGTR